MTLAFRITAIVSAMDYNTAKKWGAAVMEAKKNRPIDEVATAAIMTGGAIFDKADEMAYELSFDDGKTWVEVSRLQGKDCEMFKKNIRSSFDSPVSEQGT